MSWIAWTLRPWRPLNYIIHHIIFANNLIIIYITYHTLFKPSPTSLTFNSFHQNNITVLADVLVYLFYQLVFFFVRSGRLDGISTSITPSGGRFDAVSWVLLRDDILPSPTEFVCELRIPQANYVVKKEAIYYPGNNFKNINTNIVLIHFILIHRCTSFDSAGE